MGRPTIERTEQAKACEHGSFTCDKCQWFGGYAKPVQALPLESNPPVQTTVERPEGNLLSADHMALVGALNELKLKIQDLKDTQNALLQSMGKRANRLGDGVASKATKRTKSKKK